MFRGNKPAFCHGESSRGGGRWTAAIPLLLLMLLDVVAGIAGCPSRIAFAADSVPVRVAGIAESPTILKNTVLVGLWQNSGYWTPGAKEPNFAFNSWFPRVDFRVRGPIAVLPEWLLLRESPAMRLARLLPARLLER